MQALLNRECEISLEARAALDVAETALAKLREESNNRISCLKRDLDKKNEKIHNLEGQLKGLSAQELASNLNSPFQPAFF